MILSFPSSTNGGEADPCLRCCNGCFFEHFNTTSFVLVETPQIIGFLVGFQSQSQPQVAYIHFVGVDPEHRGKGLARSLYLHFFDSMHSRGCAEVQCITSPVNKPSIAFHEAMGFEIVPGDGMVDDVSVHKHHAGIEQHRVVFRRQLDNILARPSR